MKISVDDYEKLGAFYLGRPCDPATRELEDDLVLYDSKDLVTHGVVLGMTGSGKTGLCMALLEEAAMDNVPAVVIDPKGDIANLLLTFPDLEGKDFEPWVNEDDARRKERSVTEHAQKTADMWKNGLADWGQGPERIRQLKSKVDINVYTPGSNAGIPISILGSLSCPGFEIMDDGELLGERIESTVASLLSLIEEDADPTNSPAAVLLANIFQHSWAAGIDLSLESLILSIQKPSFDKIGILDLESFMPQKDRMKIALKFNNLIASPGFSTWMKGPALNGKRLLHSPEGKPQISIFSIAHLNDTERMFFVSLLLNEMLGWMRTQKGTTSLRAMLYMDEIYGYLPPTANPPSKKPMLTMLKQARAFGMGLLLATQNPVDLDYKALSNIGTWWLGRLQTERDKARVMDGLLSADAGLSKSEIEDILSKLDSRVFLMHNVHNDAPVTFHVRWVMSYLCGPLARGQIKTLMDPVREKLMGGGSSSSPAIAAAAANPMSNPMSRANPMSSASAKPASPRPVVGAGIDEFFVPFAGEAEGVTYLPHLIRQAEVHFSHTKSGAEGSRQIRHINPITDQGIDWDQSVNCSVPLKSLDHDPRKGTSFGELPGFAMNADNYKTLDDELADDIYRKERAEILYSDLFDVYSEFGEGEGDFRARLLQAGREERDDAMETLREKYEKKIASKTTQRKRAEITLDREKAEASQAKWSAGASIIGGVLGGLLGGRRSRRSTMSGASRAMKQHGDIGRAKEKVELIQDEIDALEKELREELSELEEKFDPTATKLDPTSIKPYKKDINIKQIGLIWLPHNERENPIW